MALRPEVELVRSRCLYTIRALRARRESSLADAGTHGDAELRVTGGRSVSVPAETSSVCWRLPYSGFSPAKILSVRRLRSLK